MNEYMLTGESVLILKIALPYNNLKFSPSEESKNSLFFFGGRFAWKPGFI